MTQMYKSVNRVIIGKGNGLSPSQHEAINLIYADLLLIGHRGTKLSEI